MEVQNLNGGQSDFCEISNGGGEKEWKRVKGKREREREKCGSEESSNQSTKANNCHSEVKRGPPSKEKGRQESGMT